MGKYDDEKMSVAIESVAADIYSGAAAIWKA